MKKEELRHDPIHERIIKIVDYLSANKNKVFQLIIFMLVAIGWYGYYSNIEKQKIIEAKSASSIAQNLYTSGEKTISLSELNQVLNNYPHSDASNQALIYILKDSYLNSDDQKVKSLVGEFGYGNEDEIIGSGIAEFLGNSLMNSGNYLEAIEIFNKAENYSGDSDANFRYKINIAIAFMANNELSKAKQLLDEISTNKDINYADRNKVDELLAFVNIQNN